MRVEQEYNESGELVKMTTYYANDNKKEVINYFLEEMSGLYQAFHPNGELKVEGNYKYDAMNGVFKYYDEYGVLIEERTYVGNRWIDRLINNSSNNNKNKKYENNLHVRHSRKA